MCNNSDYHTSCITNSFVYIQALFFSSFLLDHEAPTVHCPEDITAYVVVGVTNQSIYWHEVTGSDNAGIEGAVTCDTQNGTSFSLGRHTVECSATDKYGNVGSCQFGVHVTGELLTPCDIYRV